MTPLERDILDRFKRDVTAKYPAARIVLFGSRARGDADPDSDMDVLVVLDGPVTRAEESFVSECAWEAGFLQGIIVMSITVNKKEWEKGPDRVSLLAIAVRREGVEV